MLFSVGQKDECEWRIERYIEERDRKVFKVTFQYLHRCTENNHGKRQL